MFKGISPSYPSHSHGNLFTKLVEHPQVRPENPAEYSHDYMKQAVRAGSDPIWRNALVNEDVFFSTLLGLSLLGSQREANHFEASPF